MGAAVGNIIATIIATQMAMKRGAPRPMVSPIMSSSAAADCQARSAQAPAARTSSEARIKFLSRVSGYAAVVAILPPYFSVLRRAGPRPGVQDSAGSGHAVGHGVGQRYLPGQHHRNVALRDKVSLVDGRQHRPHHQSDEEGASDERPVEQRAPEAARDPPALRADLLERALEVRLAPAARYRYRRRAAVSRSS